VSLHPIDIAVFGGVLVGLATLALYVRFF